MSAIVRKTQGHRIKSEVPAEKGAEEGACTKAESRKRRGDGASSAASGRERVRDGDVLTVDGGVLNAACGRVGKSNACTVLEISSCME